MVAKVANFIFFCVFVESLQENDAYASNPTPNLVRNLSQKSMEEQYIKRKGSSFKSLHAKRHISIVKI